MPSDRVTRRISAIALPVSGFEMKHQQGHGPVENIIFEGQVTGIALFDLYARIGVSPRCFSTKIGAKSIASMLASPADFANAKVKLPVPQPTSRTASPSAIPVKSINSGASLRLQLVRSRPRPEH
jgi:hypothetical protein